MSNAKTIKEARKEFLADVKRLSNGDETAEHNMIAESVGKFVTKVQKQQDREARAQKAFMTAKATEFKAFAATLPTNDEE